MALDAGKNHPTIVFDGDDTLWRTMPLYTAAKRRFFALLGELGFDAKCVEQEFEAGTLGMLPPGDLRWNDSADRW
jgi:hypothetical protein